MKTNSLPQIQSPVAHLYKDEGRLANHPLSCHPQGCLEARKMREKERKMREKKRSGKTPAQFSVLMKSSLYNNLSELI